MKYYLIRDGKMRQMCADCGKRLIASGDLIVIGFDVDINGANPVAIVNPKTTFEAIREKVQGWHD